MRHALKIAFCTHSLRSDWNNGNAHFLRGLARALGRMGHSVPCFEPAEGWSHENLLLTEDEAGAEALEQFALAYPDLDIRTYRADADLPAFFLEALRECDIAIVHEWNEPEVVDAILGARERNNFIALFHDTHHRASSTPEQLKRLQVERFDGVLAFGEVLRDIYRERWGVANVWTFHEAADTTVFKPITLEKKIDVVWVGNWGDEERTRELDRFLVTPARELCERRFVVHGVRYPEDGLAKLHAAGIEFRGYLPNLTAPCVYAESRLTLHVPRRQYAEGLVGIPTIRVFEALACGIPLISAPWKDSEALFRKEDFRRVRSAEEMTAAIRELLRDDAARRQQSLCGLETILRNHTCLHRAEQLTGICEELLA